MRIANDRTGERGSTLIIVLLVTLLLLLLGVVLLGTSETESEIAANDYWAEGAFQAAEAAVQVAVDGLDAANVTQVVDVQPIGDLFEYRSGGRAAGTNQPRRTRRSRSKRGRHRPRASRRSIRGSDGHLPHGGFPQ